MAFNSVTATPVPREVNGLLVSREDLPPLLEDRVSAPTDVPVVELDAEAQVEAINGPLPTYLETKGGFSLDLGNVTNPPSCNFHYCFQGCSSFGYCRQNYRIEDLHVLFPPVPTVHLSVPMASGPAAPVEVRTPSSSPSRVDLSMPMVTLPEMTRLKKLNWYSEGSGSNANWVANLTFIKKAYPPVSGASVHTGFYTAYIQSQATVLSLVRAQLTATPATESLYWTLPWWCSCSSRCLGSLSARRQNYQGAPRIGNANFAYYVSATGITYERTVNDRDIVPHLPPQKFGFLHAGIEYWITNDISVVKICNTSLDSKICANSIVPFTSFMDHANPCHKVADFKNCWLEVFTKINAKRHQGRHNGYICIATIHHYVSSPLDSVRSIKRIACSLERNFSLLESEFRAYDNDIDREEKKREHDNIWLHTFTTRLVRSAVEINTHNNGKTNVRLTINSKS
ncbi:Alpha/Beta hydrolase protein [Phycomyces blakesleeanus]|uniref:Alpha/Beta hydrolase protein n=1 Tax=Phycomyces blakesleeanus TaxID=4837 RepID=A0ABR3B1X1_PHYBL